MTFGLVIALLMGVNFIYERVTLGSSVPHPVVKEVKTAPRPVEDTSTIVVPAAGSTK